MGEFKEQNVIISCIFNTIYNQNVMLVSMSFGYCKKYIFERKTHDAKGSITHYISVKWVSLRNKTEIKVII